MLNMKEMAVRPLTGLFLATMSLLTSGCALPLGASVASYAADGVLWLATDKTSTDHAISMSLGKDCKLWRVVKGEEVCVPFKLGEENPYDVDYLAAHREVGEGGMVTVYAAARHGGRILNDPEARDAMSRPPTPTLVATPVELAQRPERRTVEVADTGPPAATVPPSVRGGKRSRTLAASAAFGRPPMKPAARSARNSVAAAARKTPRAPARAVAGARPVPLPDVSPAPPLQAVAQASTVSPM
jgi:hypothetical protein